MDGFKHVVLKRENEVLIKTHEQCSKGKACKEPLSISMEEQKLSQFADVSSKKYAEFLEKAHPLAFAKVDPEQLIPPMDVFR